MRALPGAVLVSEPGTPEALAPRGADVAMIVVGVDDDPGFVR